MGLAKKISSAYPSNHFKNDLIKDDSLSYGEEKVIIESVQSGTSGNRI